MLTIRQWLEVNPRKSECSKCGTDVPNVPKEIAACVCSECTNLLAEIKLRKTPDEADPKICPDCGGKKLPKEHCCLKCGLRHTKTLARVRRTR